VDHAYGLIPRLCSNLGHRSPKTVLGTSLFAFNPEKVPLFVAKLSHERHDSTKNFKKSILYRISGVPDHRRPGALLIRGLRTPGRHPPVMVRQRKGGGHMNIPPPGMEMGHLAKKMGWKEKWMDSRSLAKTAISQLNQLIEGML